MSGDVEFGLACAGAVLVVHGVAWLFSSRDSPALRHARASRWAKEVDLALPVTLIDPLASRLRWRTRTGALLSVLFLAPVLGFLGWRLAHGFGHGVPTSDAPLYGPWIGVLMLAGITVAATVTDAWDLARLRRQESLSGLREVHIGLRRVVPVGAVWAARALTVLPPVLAAGLLRDAQDHGYGRWGTGLFSLFGMVMVLGLLGLRGIESYQLAVLNGRQPEGGPQTRAFDDSFRVRAVLGLVPLVPLLVYTVVSARLEPVFTDVAAHSRPPALDVWQLWQLPGFAALLLFFAVTIPKVRRYYRGSRHRPPVPQPPTMPPTTETTPC